MSTSQAFRLRREIGTQLYCFPAGMYVRGEPDGQRTWRIWPPRQPFAYIIEVPETMLRVVKRYPRKEPTWQP